MENSIFKIELPDSQRRYAILVLFVIAEIITPSDWFSCLFGFIPLYAIFEISLVICDTVVKRKK